MTMARKGRGRFLSPNEIEVNGQVLNFATAVVATGASPAVPPIKGLEGVPYMTNANFFNQTSLPARLGVVGSGAIGLELAQAMCRFGSAVTVFGRSGRILEKEDEDAAAVVKEQLARDGVVFILSVEYREIAKVRILGYRV